MLPTAVFDLPSKSFDQNEGNAARPKLGNNQGISFTCLSRAF